MALHLLQEAVITHTAASDRYSAKCEHKSLEVFEQTTGAAIFLLRTVSFRARQRDECHFLSAVEGCISAVQYMWACEVNTGNDFLSSWETN